MFTFANRVCRELRALFAGVPEASTTTSPRLLEEGLEPERQARTTREPTHQHADDVQISSDAVTLPLPPSPCVANSGATSPVELSLDEDAMSNGARSVSARTSPGSQAEMGESDLDGDEVEDDEEGPDDENYRSGGKEVEWTPEMLQSVRERNYYIFEGEDETDYTGGLSRMVLGTDGVNEGAALLMTLPLSQALQEAIKSQRIYEKAKRAAAGRTMALVNFEFELDAQIDSHQIRLAGMPEDDAEKKQALEAEVEILKLMVQEYQSEQKRIENNVQLKGDYFREDQAKANAILEEALTHAMLLEPETEQEEEPAPKLDLQSEYQAFCQKLQDVDEDALEGAMPTIDTSEDHMLVPKTDEEKAEIEEAKRLDKAVYETWEQVEIAQTNFDNRDQDRAVERQARRAAIESGEQPEIDSSKAFDVRWHQHERDLTRALIEAEEEYMAAQNAVAEHRAIDTRSARDEGYVDDDSDSDEDDSSQPEAVDPRAAPKVTRWLDRFPSTKEAPPTSLSDDEAKNADDWQAEELVYGDSMGDVFEKEELHKRARHRKQIDEWQKAQEALRATFASSS